jgi:enamine deaminase RidA (YjgF/YER057c/UK114 family)
MSPIERIKPAGVYEAKGYSHAVKRGNIVFIAGQVSKDVEGKLVGAGDIVAQVDQVFRNLKAVVEASGATLADVVKLNIYTTALEHYRPHIRGGRDKYFSEHPPATTLLVVTSLADPGFLLEIDAIALVD